MIDVATRDATIRELGEGLERVRLNADPDKVGRDLARLVLAVLDFLREVMERQAIRRMDSGALSDNEADRLGDAFCALDGVIDRLCGEFGIARAELDLQLGPLGRLIGRR